MIEGTVPLTGRKRSVWWVDPRWTDPKPFRQWLAPVLLVANLWAASPLVQGTRSERIRVMVSGLAFGVLAIFLFDRSWNLGRGSWRVVSVGSLATSAATVAVAARDFVRGLAAGLSSDRALVGSERSASDFATYLFGSLVVGLVLDQVDRRRAREARQARQLREARDAALRARLAPHFIFNALGTLQAQIEKDPAAATATTDALARLFRQALAAAGRPVVPLFWLQVLVENAVQHGVAPREDGGEIRIRARRSGYGEKPGVVLSVVNPLAPSSRPGTGNGLETLRGRLASPGDLTVSSQTPSSSTWRCRG